MASEELFRRYKKDEVQSAKEYNRVVSEVEILTKAYRAGNRGYIQNANGIFPTDAVFAGIPFHNNSGETIPAYGIVRVAGLHSGAEEDGVLDGRKPNAYGSWYSHFVNGGESVGIDSWGRAFCTAPMKALYDSADGTPAFGESWGPRSGTWKLKKNTPGFTIVGLVDEPNAVALVVQEPYPIMVGKSDTSVALYGDATVSVWSVQGPTLGGIDLADTGENVSCFARVCPLYSGQWVYIYRFQWDFEAYPIHRRLVGKTDSSHTKGATGTISIWSGSNPASLSDTGDNVTAYNRFATIGSGKWVHIELFDMGWEVTAAEC